MRRSHKAAAPQCPLLNNDANASPLDLAMWHKPSFLAGGSTNGYAPSSVPQALRIPISYLFAQISTAMRDHRESERTAMHHHSTQAIDIKDKLAVEATKQTHEPNRIYAPLSRVSALPRYRHKHIEHDQAANVAHERRTPRQEGRSIVTGRRARVHYSTWFGARAVTCLFFSRGAGPGVSHASRFSDHHMAVDEDRLESSSTGVPGAVASIAEAFNITAAATSFEHSSERALSGGASFGEHFCCLGKQQNTMIQ